MEEAGPIQPEGETEHQHVSVATRWDPLLMRMLAELQSADARAETYWAQQLAFGPVFPYAFALRLRDPQWPRLSGGRSLLRQVVELALAALGALPEGTGGVQPAALARLARRQVAALSVGRRSLLAKLARRLGSPVPSPPSTDPVPDRLLRPYPLLGWHPEPGSRSQAGGCCLRLVPLPHPADSAPLHERQVGGPQPAGRAL